MGESENAQPSPEDAVMKDVDPSDSVAEGTEPQATDTNAEEALEPEMVAPDVKPDLLEQMVDMGFSKERSTRAIHFSGNSTLEGALNWLDEHQTDTNIDEPLLVPKEVKEPKKQLTAEEAKAKAAELQAKAKARREAAEKDNEAHREKQRILMGKELSAAARIEEEQKLKRMADERKREKEEMEQARAKIRAKMEEDRKERRRKLGLPEELTPEEQEEERKKAEARAAEEAKKKLPVKPVSRVNRMREILVTMKKSGLEEAKFQVCCKTLTAYCRNVYMNLGDDSKRRINRDNKAFKERVSAVQGGVEFLHEVGFKDENGSLFFPKGEEGFEKAVLEGAGDVLNSAMTNPMFGAL